MAPLPLAVVFKTLGSRAINLPLNALRRKLVKENWFDFQNKVLKELLNKTPRTDHLINPPHVGTILKGFR